jgi:REP element-mobilizing transposase RayT
MFIGRKIFRPYGIQFIYFIFVLTKQIITVNFYNPEVHKRRSIRLQDYDYTQDGMYFITICCHQKLHYFGEVLNYEMHLNDVGEIAKEYWLAIPQHFPKVQLHEFVIMPNHIHGIIEFVGAKNFSPNIEKDHSIENFNRAKDLTPLRGTSKTIGSVVRGYKVGVTKWIRQNTSITDIWQRNYFEHIIRNDNSFNTIREYIMTNPEKWPQDKFYS